MPKPTPRQQQFADTFATLRAVLERHGTRLVQIVDKPGDFQLASPTMQDRTGRPLFVAGVQMRKSYVSFHLMPVYADPSLLEGVSAGLRKRMQGKACFNFTTIDADQVKELSALTRKGFARFKNLDLPWATPAK
jgi:hypothetical protein